MKYFEFKSRTRAFPLITGTLLNALGEDQRSLRNQLSRWRRQGLVVQLKRGTYLLNQEDRAIQPSKHFLANQLLFPSYVSLQSALAYFHIIPEAVYQVTSVTTGKTTQYHTPEGVYIFRHLKKSLLFGFQTIRDDRGLSMLLAEPEKALLDFFYLHLAEFPTNDANVFEDSFRFSNLEAIQPEKMLNYAARFDSRKLSRVVSLFVETQFSKFHHA